MVRLLEGPGRYFTDKLAKRGSSPFTQTRLPKQPPVINQVGSAFIFFCYLFLQSNFQAVLSLARPFFVPCSVNIQSKVATQVEQETGNRNIKDQVLQLISEPRFTRPEVQKLIKTSKIEEVRSKQGIKQFDIFKSIGKISATIGRLSDKKTTGVLTPVPFLEQTISI